MSFLVRLNNGCALQFIANACRRIHSIVPDDQATTFAFWSAAHTTAINHGLKFDDFYVEQITSPSSQPAGAGKAADVSSARANSTANLPADEGVLSTNQKNYDRKH